MDLGAHCDLPREEKPEKNVDEKLVNVKAFKSIISEKLLLTSASVRPITPVSNREAKSSSPRKEITSPVTPVDGVFDPFAPGPERLLHAPFCMKFRGESQINIVRRLNFDSKSDEEEMLLEIVYENLLEAIIVSKQREGIPLDDGCKTGLPLGDGCKTGLPLGDGCKTSLPLDDGCKTPECAKRISGIAETCPEAPVKCGRKSRNIDKTLCRKLDF